MRYIQLSRLIPAYIQLSKQWVSNEDKASHRRECSLKGINLRFRNIFLSSPPAAPIYLYLFRYIYIYICLKYESKTGSDQYIYIDFNDGNFFYSDGMVMFFFPRHHCHRWFFNGFTTPSPSPLNVYLKINHWDRWFFDGFFQIQVRWSAMVLTLKKT